MRTPTKLKFLFLAIAVFGYWVSNVIMPETLDGIESISLLLSQLRSFNLGVLGLVTASLILFVVIPVAHWFFVIKANSQSAWKILIVFSLSCLIARYQYPPELAKYFEFFAWVRYPFIAILIAFELYLGIAVVKSLWKARLLSGDPRVNVLTKYQEGSKELEFGLLLAYETASWYYAVPKFSRDHPRKLAQLNLLSSRLELLIFFLVILPILSIVSYLALVEWSYLAAIIASTFIFASCYMCVANYRCSKHYSIYVKDSYLVINNSWLGLMCIELENIAACEKIDIDIDKEMMCLGRGQANISLKLKVPQTYYAMMGMLNEKVNKVNLSVEDPTEFLTQISKHIAKIQD